MLYARMIKLSENLGQAKALAFLATLFASFGISNRAAADIASENPLHGLPVSRIAQAYGPERAYNITRNGKKIGTHTLTFAMSKDELLVNVEASLVVTVLRIPVYRLNYVSEEVWRNDALVAASATTTDNGKSTTVSLDNDALPSDTHFASNHWHPGVLTGDAVFNTLTGESSNITVTGLGLENVNTPAANLQAYHYQYEDDIHANVWYDLQGVWLRMTFKGDDGSTIEYLRQD